MITLEEFVETVEVQSASSPITDILALLRPFEELAIADWRDTLNEENGRPVTTTLFQSEQLRLVLIYWEAGKRSSVHGHPGGGGLIRVLDGCLEETRFEPGTTDEVIDHHSLPAGSLGYIHDAVAYHQVSNTGAGPAVSLHVYSLAEANA